MHVGINAICLGTASEEIDVIAQRVVCPRTPSRLVNHLRPTAVAPDGIIS